MDIRIPSTTAMKILPLIAILAGCATTENPPASRGDAARLEYIQCLTDYIHASNLTNHKPNFEESGSEDFCGPEERIYRSRIDALAFRVPESRRRETSDIVIRETWQEITR
jgi:hypothetical protein